MHGNHHLISVFRSFASPTYRPSFTVQIFVPTLAGHAIPPWRTSHTSSPSAFSFTDTPTVKGTGTLHRVACVADQLELFKGTYAKAVSPYRTFRGDAIISLRIRLNSHDSCKLYLGAAV
jgi:hypothetical protein